MSWEIGNRVWVDPDRRGWVFGTVTDVDASGVSVRFDQPVNGVLTCHATRGELRPVTTDDPPVGDTDTSGGGA